MRLVSNSMRLLLACTGCVFSISEGIAGDKTPPTPSAIIAKMADEIYVAGETGGRYSAAAERGRQRMRAYVEANPEAALLVERNAGGLTPLSAAASLGFSELVEELLKSKLVVEKIDDQDKNGLTAWMHASLGIRIGIWACNPKLWDDPMRAVPRFVTFGYYIEGDEKTYHRVRSALEASGASRDAEAAKAFWLKQCVNQTADTRAKISGAADLLDTISAEGASAFLIGMQALQKRK